MGVCDPQPRYERLTASSQEQSGCHQQDQQTVLRSSNGILNVAMKTHNRGLSSVLTKLPDLVRSQEGVEGLPWDLQGPLDGHVLCPDGVDIF